MAHWRTGRADTDWDKLVHWITAFAVYGALITMLCSCGESPSAQRAQRVEYDSDYAACVRQHGTGNSRAARSAMILCQDESKVSRD